MCGIAGISLIKPNPKLSREFFKIKKLLDHRGPDNFGSFINSHLSLLHTRLSIVDIKGGYQPIKNKDKILIANGEIYNDLEIRKKNKSFKFKSKSDSESILAVYNNHGVSGLKKLRGMFAYAIYDRSSDELIIGRDEFGIKPLYFRLIDEGFIFCSEIKPLRSMKLSKDFINYDKTEEYMQLQYCSGYETIFNEIKRVEPGQILIIKRGRILKSFKNILPKKQKKFLKNIDENYINNSLTESISSHLRSDVPYCVFFSGGIDSMLLLYYLKKLNKENVTAFSIYFSDDSYDDFSQITKDYKIEIVKQKFSEDDFWNSLFFAADKIDEPVADYAILPTLKLASIASKKFKVALTGEGGDELFGGYGRYKKTQRFFFKKRNYFPKGEFSKLFSKKKFVHWNYKIKNLDRIKQMEDLTNLQKIQLFDYHNWLPNNLLVKLDRCLMTFGMEGRTPFIDKILFEKLFFIADNHKINQGFGKYFIRRFLQSKIPSYNAFEKKRGFTVPIYEWIPKKIKYLEELLLKQEFLYEYFTRDELIELFKSVRKNKKFAKAVWHIIFFTSWYLVNIKGIKKRGNFFDILSSIN